MFTKIQQGNIALINKHLKIFEVFRQRDIEIPVGQIIFFLHACKMEGASLREIADVSGVKMTTASRYLSNLSAKGQFKEKGLGLLHAEENPENRRMKCITLTDEGRSLLQSLEPSKKGA